MLRFEKLVVENFGPFKGSQEILFPNDGVAVIYGENMRGKTMLLNAIRFALFGRMLTRAATEVDLHQVGNWEKAEEGEYGFKVKLFFSDSGHRFELTRAWVPRQQESPPESDSDYKMEVVLVRDGSVLSPEERDSELHRTMPEQVSRFFLFDAELLQEYEQLIGDESEEGLAIAQAIERILGLPIITNARSAIDALRTEAQREFSRSAQKELATKELGEHLERRTEERDHHKEEVNRLKGVLGSLREEERRLQEYLSRFQKSAALLDERDRAKEDLKRLMEKTSEKRERLQTLLSTAWRDCLRPLILDLRDEARVKLSEIESQEKSRAVERELTTQREQAVKRGTCPVCSTQLDSDAKDRLEKENSEVPGSTEPIDEKEKSRLESNVVLLGDLAGEDNRQAIVGAIEAIEDNTIEITDKKNRIQDIEQQIGNLNESEYRLQSARFKKVVAEIYTVQRGIGKQTEALTKVERRIKDLVDKLGAIGAPDAKSAQEREASYSDLYGLFDAAVTLYRDRLRDRVERDASDLFRKLTSEPQYAGLRINENYGLVIVHEDGSDIRVRSAGAEHVVALCLVGALQRNAPLHGPIVIDSPFGRLDEVHTEKVTTALPEMADQVILLVYEAELKPEIARRLLGGSLRTEYHMSRESARYTELVKGGSPDERGQEDLWVDAREPVSSR